MLTTENLREMHFDSSSRLRTAFIKEDPQVRSLLAGWRTADCAPHTADRSPTIHQHTRVKAGPRVQARATRTAPHPGPCAPAAWARPLCHMWLRCLHCLATAHPLTCEVPFFSLYQKPLSSRARALPSHPLSQLTGSLPTWKVAHCLKATGLALNDVPAVIAKYTGADQ